MPRRLPCRPPDSAVRSGAPAGPAKRPVRESNPLPRRAHHMICPAGFLNPARSGASMKDDSKQTPSARLAVGALRSRRASSYQLGGQTRAGSEICRRTEISGLTRVRPCGGPGPPVYRYECFPCRGCRGGLGGPGLGERCGACRQAGTLPVERAEPHAPYALSGFSPLRDGGRRVRLPARFHPDYPFVSGAGVEPARTRLRVRPAAAGRRNTNARRYSQFAADANPPLSAPVPPVGESCTRVPWTLGGVEPRAVRSRSRWRCWRRCLPLRRPVVSLDGRVPVVPVGRGRPAGANGFAPAWGDPWPVRSVVAPATRLGRSVLVEDGCLRDRGG